MPETAPLPDRLEFVRFSDAHAGLGESPVWDGDAVWWVDCTGKSLFRTRASSGATERWATPEHPGFAVRCDGGGIAVGMESGIFAFDARTATFRRLIAIDRPGCRFNDAAVAPDGTLWAGIQALDATVGAGDLYRIAPGGAFHLFASGLTFPNGLAFDSGRGRMYFSDSHPASQTVWQTDWPHRADNDAPRAVFADFAAQTGRPDGAALDSDGNYWIAAVDGGALLVFSPDGSALRRYPMPFQNPTKLAFGGSGGRLIAVTSKGGDGRNGALGIAEIPAGHAICGARTHRWVWPAPPLATPQEGTAR